MTGSQEVAIGARLRRAAVLLTPVVMLAAACGGQSPAATTRVEATTGATSADGGDTTATSNAGAGAETLSDGSIVCRPRGTGPFPAVLYNHGGKGSAIGGDLEGTCEALAAAGYVARSEKRPESVTLAGQLDDVLDGLASLRARPDVDGERVAVMGYSRGGLLTLQSALARPGDLRVALLLAPAPGNGSMATTLMDVTGLEAPVHVYVAENDTVPNDLVQLARDVESALTAAGKEVTLTIYPPFGRDGHALFDEVQDPYWSDVMAALDSVLRG